MKNFLSKCFGIFGVALYYILAIIIRIPVAVFLLVVIAFFLIILNPILGRDDTADWIGDLYKWYLGE